MAFIASDPPRRRRLHKWTGGKLGRANDADSKQPLYIAPAGAYSVQAVQRKPPTPSVTYCRPHNGAATSMLQLPPRPIPVPPVAAYATVATASPYHTTQYPNQKPGSDLTKWTSYTNLTQSVSNLVSHTTGKANATILDLEDLVMKSVGGGSNVREATSQLLDQVITLIDIGSFCGRETELRK